MEFPHYNEHICLVSAQTLPNYLGAVIPNALPKKVHLVITPQMKKRAEILRTALKEQKIDVEGHNIPDSGPNTVAEVLDRIYEHADKQSLAINVTGGTKVMALTAVEWAAIQDDPKPFLFYVDTDNKRILRISGDAAQYDLTVKLKLEKLFAVASGNDIAVAESNALAQKERDTLDQLVEIFLKNPNILELFNKCAAAAGDTCETSMPKNTWKDFNDTLTIAQDAGKLTIQDNKIRYTSDEARFWCNGGWLEDFVKSKLIKCQYNGIIDDRASNLRVLYSKDKDKDKDKNELDAAFTVDNRLFIIECKTSNLNKSNKVNDTIYKLNTLRDEFGGALARAMIVSVHPISPMDIERCNDHKIKLVTKAQIPDLENQIKKWINPAG